MIPLHWYIDVFTLVKFVGTIIFQYGQDGDLNIKRVHIHSGLFDYVIQYYKTEVLGGMVSNN